VIALWRRRRESPPLTADTSKLDEAMRAMRQSLENALRPAAERVIEAMRPVVEYLNFIFWLKRSGQRLCSGDHEDLVGRCPICKAST
jgi:hypothetical protein